MYEGIPIVLLSLASAEYYNSTRSLHGATESLEVCSMSECGIERRDNLHTIRDDGGERDSDVNSLSRWALTTKTQRPNISIADDYVEQHYIACVSFAP